MCEMNSLLNRFIALWLSFKFRIVEAYLLPLKRKDSLSPKVRPQVDPMISLIIATYNRGGILTERTIPAILEQTYQNFEVLIVGDHCADNTPELMRQKIKDSRVKFLDLPERGKYPIDPSNRWFVQGSIPRNKGLALAQGDWLAWISDDDVLLPNHFESLLRFAQKGNYEFVSASYTFERNGEAILQDASSFSPRIGGMQTWLYRSYLRFFKWNTQSWRKVWNRPCDYDLQDRMVRAGVRMGFLNEVVAHVPAVEGTHSVGFEAVKLLSGQSSKSPSPF